MVSGTFIIGCIVIEIFIFTWIDTSNVSSSHISCFVAFCCFKLLFCSDTFFFSFFGLCFSSFFCLFCIVFELLKKRKFLFFVFIFLSNQCFFFFSSSSSSSSCSCDIFGRL